MKDKSTRIVIEFKESLKQSGTKDDSTTPNLLVFEISPNEGIVLQLNTRDPLQRGQFKPMQIDFQEDLDNVPEAYENLILDALHGDSTFFAHWDEVELSWQWVQPILEAYEENLVPLRLYAAGTNGPAESDLLLEQDGFQWWFDEKYELENQENESIQQDQFVLNTNN
ncbi:glucose-6-phosphate 1-dehydrogenase [Paenibacillus pini JCM 16418]|uniref:Glucose-6-phosphate 1-dehydrogenase n=1 Tax=Paenibacillus pini JCM 16418 TaxID=1236976 RepID=W7YLB6_9BACL|nr:glucose-6-phosphate 1-dehydrogenase [Paenibacillus pini JCM 16418]